MSLAGSSPGPTLTAPSDFESRSRSWPAIPAWAMTRLPVMQNCPLNVVTALVRTGTTTSRSASSKTIIGVLPPSSRDSRFSVMAASAMIWRPTRVLPV